MSPAKAARVSLARAADTAFNMALRVNGIRQSRLDLAEVVDHLNDDWGLFPLLHDDGSVGLMCFEPACIIAFVEHQTMGHVNASAQDARGLTQTDKALTTPFLEGFLRQFDDALTGAPTSYWTCGYHAEDAVLSKHLMVLQLDGAEYRGFEMLSEVGGIERAVKIKLFLPIKEKAPVPSKQKKVQKAGAPENPKTGDQSMRLSALSANIEMDAVMCKLLMPLSELNNLHTGQLVPLPQNAIQQARLVDRTGRTAQGVRLGQLHGMRAVRLVQDLPKDAAHLTEQLEKPKASIDAGKPTAKHSSEQLDRVDIKNTDVSSTRQGDDPEDELDALLNTSKSQ